MSIRSVVLAFGALCGFLGFYLLPFGQDLVNFVFIDYLGNGDYWTGMAYMYAVSGVLIAIFLTITCKGLVSAMGGPVLFYAGLAVLLFLGYETMKIISGALSLC